MATLGDILELKVRVDTKTGEVALDRFTGKAQRSGRTATREFDKFNATMGKLRNALYLGGASSLLVGGVAAMDRFARRATQIDGVTRSFNRLTDSVGINAQVLEQKMRKATRGAVTDLEAMRQVNQALLLGIPASTETMAEMAEIAEKLGRAVGLDAANSLESLITGVGRQSKLMLDNLGIVIDTNLAYEIYAQKLGVSSSELTDAQRKLAFFNETMLQARNKTAQVGEQTDKLGDKWKRLTSTVTNAINDIIDGLNNLGQAQTRLSLTGLLGALTPGAGAPLLTGTADSFVTGGFLGEPLMFSQHGAAAAEAAAATSTLRQETEELVKLLPDLNQRTSIYNDLMEWHVNMVLQGTDAMHDYSEVVAEMSVVMESLAGPDGQFEGGAAALAWYNEVMDDSVLKTKSVAEVQAVLGEQARITAQQYLTAGHMMAQSLAILFPKSKAAAYANAVINTAQGITEALKLPFPLSFIVAGMVGAAGTAQMARISSTNLGSTGGGGFGGAGISGGGLGSGAGFTSPLGDSGPGQRQVEIHIFLEGQGFIQDPDSFAREMSRSIEREMTRGGSQGIF